VSSLTREQVGALDPYSFLAVLGKRVIHPGGRASTDQLLAWAGLRPGDRVLDTGCGVQDGEFAAAHIPGAQHRELGSVAEAATSLPPGRWPSCAGTASAPRPPRASWSVPVGRALRS
jgi:hypothetical protein